MASLSQRNGSIQKPGRVADDLSASLRVVSRSRRLAVIAVDNICAIQSVVQTAPTSIGGIQGKASVADRYDQLRPGDGRDLGIDIFCRDLERGALLGQVVDVL